MTSLVEKGISELSWFRKSADAAQPLDVKPIDWRVNLAVVWVTQFISLSAIYFCIPFLPLYLKQKNFVPLEDTALWSGIFIGAAPASMMIMSPIWGSLGDRYGRKIMIVRSTLAAAVVFYMMGVVESMGALIVLRVMQGVFTGIIPSAQGLVAAQTPNNRQGLAMGLMMGAINASFSVGSYFGGIFAARYGAAATFQVGGLMQILVTVLVIFGVRENFVPPTPEVMAASQSARLRKKAEKIAGFWVGVPALIGIAFVAVLQTYDGPILPLYIDELYRNALSVSELATLDDAAINAKVFPVTGYLTSAAGIVSVGGSMFISYLMDRKTSRWLWVAISLLCAGGMVWVCVEQSIFGLATGRLLFMFFVSGLASILVVILSRMTHSSKRGGAMGWTVSARCVGWAAAPVVGGWVGQTFGYVSSYWLLGILCLFLIPFFIYLTSRYPGAFSGNIQNEEPDIPVRPPAVEDDVDTGER